MNKRILLGWALLSPLIILLISLAWYTMTLLGLVWKDYVKILGVGVVVMVVGYSAKKGYDILEWYGWK